MVLKAYSSFVCNFSIAMDSIKETCKLVPAFFNFLKVCILIIFFNIYIDEGVARKVAKEILNQMNAVLKVKPEPFCVGLSFNSVAVELFECV